MVAVGRGGIGLTEDEREMLGDPDVALLDEAPTGVEAGGTERLAAFVDDVARLDGEVEALDGAKEADADGTTAEELVGMTTMVRRCGT